MLDAEKVREHLRSRGFYACGFRGAPSDRRRGYVRVWWSAGGWQTLRGLHVQIVIPTDPENCDTFADSVRDALDEIGLVRDAGRWVQR